MQALRWSLTRIERPASVIGVSIPDPPAGFDALRAFLAAAGPVAAELRDRRIQPPSRPAGRQLRDAWRATGTPLRVEDRPDQRLFNELLDALDEIDRWHRYSRSLDRRKWLRGELFWAGTPAAPLPIDQLYAPTPGGRQLLPGEVDWQPSPDPYVAGVAAVDSYWQHRAPYITDPRDADAVEIWNDGSVSANPGPVPEVLARYALAHASPLASTARIWTAGGDLLLPYVLADVKQLRDDVAAVLVVVADQLKPA